MPSLVKHIVSDTNFPIDNNTFFSKMTGSLFVLHCLFILQIWVYRNNRQWCVASKRLATILHFSEFGTHDITHAEIREASTPFLLSNQTPVGGANGRGSCTDTWLGATGLGSWGRERSQTVASSFSQWGFSWKSNPETFFLSCLIPWGYSGFTASWYRDEGYNTKKELGVLLPVCQQFSCIGVILD